ncbi:MAG: YceD family protein [Thermoanaerobaculia bacterium]
MKHVLDFKRVAESGPQRIATEIAIEPSQLAREEVERLSPVRVDALVEEGDEPREFVVSGSIAFEVDLVCARCLEPYPFAVHSDFTLRYRPRPVAAGQVGAEEVEIETGELEQEFYEEPLVALEPVILEQVQLALPMKPLCDEQRQGLCPQCGTNLNRETCACGAEESDHRWDALRGIRDQLVKKKEI